MSAPPNGVLFYEPRAKPLSTTGQQQPGSYYQFYLTQTTTPTNVYADGGLVTPLSQTPGTGGTTAASDGRLVPIYLDPSVIYRVQLYSSFGVLLEDTDPFIPQALNSAGAIGKILYPQTPDELALGVTPTNFFYPAGYVDRYGTNTTPGTTDMTTAIQTAINVLNNWSTYSTNIGSTTGSSPDFQRGGTVVFQGSSYLVSNPILLAPGIMLKGVCTVNIVGSNSTNVNITRIVAGSSFPTTGYVLDTGTWRLKNETTGAPVTPVRAVLATDMFYLGNDKDNSVGTFMANMMINGIYIDGANVAFGGIRIQVASNFRLQNFSIRNTQYVGLTTNSCYEFAVGTGNIAAPIAWNANGCESIMQDEGELWLGTVTSTTGWVAGNQSTINTVFYPSAQQINPTVWYNLTMKTLLFAWCINVTLGYLFIAAGTVGLEFYKANVNILHLENEFTTGGAIFLLQSGFVTVDGLKSKSAIPLATGDGNSKLVIREPHLLACTTTFTALNSETSSVFEVQIYNQRQPDPVLGVMARFSTINITKLFPYEGTVTIWVDDSIGNVALDGFQNTTPTTLNGALKWINNNPHILTWVVKLRDGATQTVSSAFSLVDTTVQFQRDFSGASLPTMTMTQPISIVRSKVILSNMGLSGWTAPAAFTCIGLCQFDLPLTGVTIPASCVVWEATSNNSARILATGYGATVNFGSGSALCSGGPSNSVLTYEDVFGGQVFTGTPALEAITSGKVKLIASSLVSQLAGWGAPTGATVVANFPGATATLVQCSESIAEIITSLQKLGIYGG